LLSGSFIWCDMSFKKIKCSNQLLITEYGNLFIKDNNILFKFIEHIKKFLIEDLIEKTKQSSI
jgi:hypothetical protein